MMTGNGNLPKEVIDFIKDTRRRWDEGKALLNLESFKNFSTSLYHIKLCCRYLTEKDRSIKLFFDEGDLTKSQSNKLLEIIKQYKFNEDGDCELSLSELEKLIDDVKSKFSELTGKPKYNYYLYHNKSFDLCVGKEEIKE